MDTFPTFLLITTLVVGFFFLFSWALMLVLGALLPTFGLATVSFWQAAGIKLAAVLIIPTTSGAGAVNANK